DEDPGAHEDPGARHDHRRGDGSKPDRAHDDAPGCRQRDRGPVRRRDRLHQWRDHRRRRRGIHHRIVSSADTDLGQRIDSLRPFYADWAGYNRRTIEGLRRLSVEDLALPVLASRDQPGEPWPIWAVAGHVAAVRVFWLCDVFGEPGAEATPFAGDTPGWEDDLTHPRTAEELAGALESTWQVIEGCLDRWT